MRFGVFSFGHKIFKDSRIQRFKRFKDSRIQGFKDSKIQRFKDSKIESPPKRGFMFN
jgi:hypothetical protein